MSSFTKRFGKPLVYCGIFIYFFVMRYFLITAGDDYYWISDKGQYLLEHHFYGPEKLYGGNSNGRYLGSILEIFTVKNVLFGMIVFAIFLTLLTWCISQLLGNTWQSTLMALFLIFSFQGKYVTNILCWNAGFVNYVPSITLLLCYLVIVQRQLRESSFIFKHTIFMTFLAFLVSFAGGFFAEHVTIFQVGLGALVILVGLVFKGTIKLKPFNYSYLLGACLSFVLMFSNPSYFEESDYRGAGTSLVDMINNYATTTHFWFVTLNFIPIVIICGSLIVIAISDKSRKLWDITGLSLIFVIYYTLANTYLSSLPIDKVFISVGLSARFSRYDALVSGLFVIFIGYAILRIFLKDKNNILLFFSYFSYLALFLPFFIILHPLNIRGMFASYIFLYLITMIFLTRALKVSNLNKSKFLNIFVAVCLVVLFANLQTKMVINYQANLKRVDNVEYLSGKKLLTKHVPFRDLVMRNDDLSLQDYTYWKAFLKK